MKLIVITQGTMQYGSVPTKGLSKIPVPVPMVDATTVCEPYETKQKTATKKTS